MNRETELGAPTGVASDLLAFLCIFNSSAQPLKSRSISIRNVTLGCPTRCALDQVDKCPTQSEAIIWSKHVSQRIRFDKRNRPSNGLKRLLMLLDSRRCRCLRRQRAKRQETHHGFAHRRLTIQLRHSRRSGTLSAKMMLEFHESVNYTARWLLPAAIRRQCHFTTS